MIYRDSMFDGDPWGGGGRKRTAQIGEILSSNDLDERHFISCPQLTPESLLAAGDNKGQLRIGERTLQLPLGSKREQELGRHIEQCKQIFLKETGGKGCLLWEHTGSSNYLTILAAQQAGLSVIAVPHNLESLVPSQRSVLSGRFSPDCFDEELAFLGTANSVFVISREEQWLLRLHGITANYLPYHPPGIIAEYLSDIRAKRQHSAQSGGYLLLGTAGNPPTLQGMAEVIRSWPLTGRGHTLHVAGFFTEQLDEVVAKSIPDSAGVRIHGTVNNEELVELLVSVQAVILHQPPTTGALTRIPEMLLAGVPLLVNENAARNAYQTEGLYIYNDPAELQSMLATADFPMPPPPLRPTDFEKKFIASVLKLSGK